MVPNSLRQVAELFGDVPSRSASRPHLAHGGGPDFWEASPDGVDAGAIASQGRGGQVDSCPPLNAEEASEMTAKPQVEEEIDFPQCREIGVRGGQVSTCPPLNFISALEPVPRAGLAVVLGRLGLDVAGERQRVE